jgi:hypothetical protein
MFGEAAAPMQDVSFLDRAVGVGRAGLSCGNLRARRRAFTDAVRAGRA